MDTGKRVLILYASAGLGHEKAAKGILEAYRELYPEVDVRRVDVLSLISPFVRGFYKKVYAFQIQYAPWLWGAFYYSFNVPWIYFFMRFVRRAVNSGGGAGIEKTLIHEKPSVIIHTHFLSTEIASHLKENKKIDARMLTVMTDYLPHIVWIGSGVDVYTVALPETKEGLVKRGVPEEKIKVLGIPVERKFSTKQDPKALRRKLSLREDVFTVLVTSGGAGIGAVEDVIQGLGALKADIQVMGVCGTNKKLQSRLSGLARRDPRIKLFGFVNNMEELMEASDLVIGKGGGLTVTECLAKEKPMILFRSVPGQESRNAACVQRHRAGIATDSVTRVVSAVSEFLKSPQEMQLYKEGVLAMARPGAAEAIVRLAEHLRTGRDE